MSYHLTIRDMNQEDVEKFKLKQNWMYERFKYYLSANLGPALTIENGEPICSFGAVFEWQESGSCEVWFSIIEKKYMFNIARILKRLLPELADKYGIKRMQALIQIDKVNIRFIEFLGFVNETPFGMKNRMYDGQTAYLYAKYF